jgi:hypothetical protein
VLLSPSTVSPSQKTGADECQNDHGCETDCQIRQPEPDQKDWGYPSAMGNMLQRVPTRLEAHKDEEHLTEQQHSDHHRGKSEKVEK